MEELKKEEQPSDLENKCNEYLNGWRRAQADLANYKKDEAKRFEDLIKFSNEKLILDLLNVLDSFELSLKSKAMELDPIFTQLESLLKSRGLEKIKVETNTNFDPNFHEAILNIDSELSSGLIVEEFKSGYILNGKVIRPSQVSLAK